MTVQTSRLYRAAASAVAACCLALAFTTPVVAEEQSTPTIEHIDIVHTTHTDIGFTDHPEVCRRQQMRYLDIAIDAALATADRPAEERFHWTAETTLAVDDWWRAADPKRREDFLQAVGTGQLEVAAMAMNQTPAMNHAEWHAMLHWLPEDLWKKVNPRVAIQNDVNGFPRAGAVMLLDRGVEYLAMGINTHNGEAPMKRPSAFWWKMPDGRKMFVWLGDHYASGFYYFNTRGWRRGPIPRSTDTRYRSARPGDFFQSDEASVRESHKHLLGRLKTLQSNGYEYPTLVVSVTNEWRMDNDPPFPALADFVATWKRLGLKPTISLSSAGDALERLKGRVGDKIPEYSGEWTDWWANGTASGPREVAASRKAKRLTAAALSPAWGKPDERTTKAADEIYRDLCLFDEHTWGSSESLGQPHSLETWAQYNEKSRAAYRPMALSKMLLAQRARSTVYPRGEGFYVANTTGLPYSGWLTMPKSALRGSFNSLEDPNDGRKTPLLFGPGYACFSPPANPGELTDENQAQTFADNKPDQVARFWVDNLPGNTIKRFALSEETVESPKAKDVPTVVVDDGNWPTSARWPGMEKPLFESGTGEVLSVDFTKFASRWYYTYVFRIDDPEKHARKRAGFIKETVAAAASPASVERNSHTTVYTQEINHPRFKWGTRRLELWHGQPRARLTVRFRRIQSELPEIIFVASNLPCKGTLPKSSVGGMPFVPYEDQLPGSCRDYFTIDDWVQYSTPRGRWLWVTRDAPLVTFGGHNVLAQVEEPPKEANRVLAMVFNNVWVTNFVADNHGILEFNFEMAQQSPNEKPDDPARLAETLQSEPQVIINPGLKEHPIFMDRLHRP